ncbi:PEP-CTERM sorting domain-containing protein [Haloferula sp.]|uniref:PEP-CTERM sorting domain-containing protein n=1 Tax=Haloferula sp. TaxID=2497595 RepID=UPI00329B10AE
MKTHSILALVSMLTIGSASAATGIFGSYAEIFTTSPTVYVAQSYGGSNPAFDGANFGTFTSSDTLTVSNASVLTFKNSGAGENVTGSEIQWRVFKNGDSPGSFATIGINFESNSPNTDLGGQSFTGGDDQEWRDLAAAAPDLIAAATAGNGDYTVEIFFRSDTSIGERFSNNGGSNYKAEFTLVPEPSIALLGGLGLLGILRRRRA